MTTTHSSHSRFARRQKGFTLIELMIGIAVASLLTYLGVQILGGRQDTARLGSARTFFIQDMPGALTSYGSAVGQNTTITEAEELLPYGVSADTAWGEAWTISNNGDALNGVTVNYPVGGSNPDELGANLISILKSKKQDSNKPQFPYISNPGYANGSVTAKIRQF